MDTYATGVTIVIADSGGNAKMWSTVNSWMMVTCYGTNALEISDISSEFGQLAELIMNFAHDFLDDVFKSNQTDGASKFINDNGSGRCFSFQDDKQFIDLLCFRHEIGWPHELTDRRIRLSGRE